MPSTKSIRASYRTNHLPATEKNASRARLDFARFSPFSRSKISPVIAKGVRVGFGVANLPYVTGPPDRLPVSNSMWPDAECRNSPRPLPRERPLVLLIRQPAKLLPQRF